MARTRGARTFGARSYSARAWGGGAESTATATGWPRTEHHGLLLAQSHALDFGLRSDVIHGSQLEALATACYQVPDLRGEAATGQLLQYDADLGVIALEDPMAAVMVAEADASDSAVLATLVGLAQITGGTVGSSVVAADGWTAAGLTDGDDGAESDGLQTRRKVIGHRIDDETVLFDGTKPQRIHPIAGPAAVAINDDDGHRVSETVASGRAALAVVFGSGDASETLVIAVAIQVPADAAAIDPGAALILDIELESGHSGVAVALLDSDRIEFAMTSVTGAGRHELTIAATALGAAVFDPGSIVVVRLTVDGGKSSWPGGKTSETVLVGGVRMRFVPSVEY